MVKKWGAEIVSQSLLDTYYQAVAASRAEDIERNVKADLLLLEAGALTWFDVESFSNTVLSKVIGLFRWPAQSPKAGWALLADRAGLHVNLPPADGLDASRAWLAGELGFKGVAPDKDLDRGIESYCRFLQRANGHRFDGRPDEAFLHFVVALDLLLGSEGRSADSVAARVALLVHRPLETSLNEQIRQIKRLYDLRSKYVHEGRSVGADDVDRVDQTCAEVLWAILYTSANESIRSVEEWVRKIDYLSAALQAGVSVIETDFRSVGVAPPGVTRRPPCRVKDPGPRSRFVPMELWRARQ